MLIFTTIRIRREKKCRDGFDSKSEKSIPLPFSLIRESELSLEVLRQRAGSGCLTFVQPVGDAIKDDALLSGRRKAPGAALHIRLIVDVVLKDVDL